MGQRLLLELELDELLELEFEELLEELFELELDELFEELLELEFDELLDELFDERLELELPELLELRLLELFTLELDERRVPVSAPLPRRSLSRPTLRAAVVRPRSQALKKPCTGVRARVSARRSVFVSSACAAPAVRAPTTAAVIRAVCLWFMRDLSCVVRWTKETPPADGAALRGFTGSAGWASPGVHGQRMPPQDIPRAVCKGL
jgi:hypothetical protein